MKKSFPAALLLFSLAAFAAALVYALDRYLERGQAYPECSSLRADPKGTSILYESLARIRGLSARRDFGEKSHLRRGGATTCLYLGCRIQDWDRVLEYEAELIERFLDRGGRLVLTMGCAPREEAPKGPSPKEFDRGKEAESVVSFQERWGFGFEDRSRQARLSRRALAAESVPAELPRQVSWRGSLVLAGLSEAWRVVYTAGGEPVLAERQFASGSVVVATDSWFLTNEALVQERHPELLAWLIGPSERVVFDETHLGLVEEPGVAYLIRKYRLYGALGAIFAVAALAAWRRCSSLVPPREESATREIVGRDSARGFVSLLRRNIPERELIRACLAEWKKTFAPEEKSSASGRLQAVEEAEKKLKGKSVSITEAYRALSEAAKRRRRVV